MIVIYGRGLSGGQPHFSGISEDNGLPERGGFRPHMHAPLRLDAYARLDIRFPQCDNSESAKRASQSHR